MQRATCFACGKEGHWAKDCPTKSANKVMPSSTKPTFINDQAIPDKQCPHCGETCFILTSLSESNPGRKYYRCPENPGYKNFFQWCDQASPDQGENILPSPKLNLMNSDKKQDSPESSYPECSCGAGICNICTADTPRNKGRKFFVCPVKKGQGACNFFQWQDGLGNADHIYQSENINTLIMTSNSHEEKATYEDLNGTVPPGSAEKGSSSEHFVKGDMIDLDFGFDNPLLPPIGDLKLSETKKSAVVKPGTCHRCGKEGHWFKDCLRPFNSTCYKCGKVGHWMKDCTA